MRPQSLLSANYGTCEKPRKFRTQNKFNSIIEGDTSKTGPVIKKRIACEALPRATHGYAQQSLKLSAQDPDQTQ